MQENETISSIYEGAWLERALYVAENRAIPSVIDGLKPVQRFLLYSGYKNCKTSFAKVAGIGSVVSAYGYHHGEGSAQGALSEMAKDYSNNLPLFEGDGAFGSVLSPIPAAPRYIYAKLAPYIDDLFLDNDLAPKHEDEEHLPPKYYLPIIPMVLINGIKGIATGYATNIPPFSHYDIIKCLKDKIEKNDFEEPVPTFYKFKGKVEKDGSNYIITAPFEMTSPIKIHILDLPYGNTSESYETFLKKLLEKDIITDYENNSSGNTFDYIVTIKKGTRWTEEEVLDRLKLRVPYKCNLTTVSENGKIQEWKNIKDIINYFYDFRIKFVSKRIETNLVNLKTQKEYLTGIIGIIEDVVSGKLDLKNKKEKDLYNIIKNDYNVPDQYIQKIMDMPFRTFSDEKKNDLAKKLKCVTSEIHRLEKTTPEKEYLTDLEKLEKSILNAIDNQK